MILITRPQPEASKLAELLVARGFKYLIDSMLNIVHLNCAPINLQAVQALVFTSTNGVLAYSQTNSNSDVLAVTVGEATAQAALEAGFSKVLLADGNVNSLLDKIVAELSPDGGKILHCSGETVRGDLIAALGSKGYQAERQVLYRAEAAGSLLPETTRALANEKINTVLFFSPRSGVIFARLLAELHLTKNCSKISALCLSDAVADTISKLPWRNVKIAERPTTSALVYLTRRSNNDSSERTNSIY